MEEHDGVAEPGVHVAHFRIEHSHTLPRMWIGLSRLRIGHRELRANRHLHQSDILPYSLLSAIAGSTRVARTAGIPQATIATTTSVATARSDEMSNVPTP